jgi:GT2 family glycosyltransferase
MKNEIKMITLSIIIVNYKSWKDLEKCLNSLKKITLKTIIFEVIIVDNLSNDGMFNQFIANFPEFSFVLNSANYGFAHACNLGVTHANGEFLMFLNPDTIIEKGTLETLMDVAQKNSDYKLISCNKVNAKGVFEKIDKPFPGLLTLFGFMRFFYKTPTHQKCSQKQIIFPKWLSGSLVLMQRDWYKKIGGWNEDYWMYYEDVDLSLRTTRLGGKIAHINNIKIIHNHGGSSRINRQTKALTKSEVIISKHVYVDNNFSRLKRIIAQTMLLIGVLLSKSVLFVLSLFFYFIPKFRVNITIGKNLLRYYLGVLKNKSWLSPRSINFNRVKLNTTLKKVTSPSALHEK